MSASTHLHLQKILILMRVQYTQLIARRVRELGVYCEIHPLTVSDQTIKVLHQPELFYRAALKR